MTTPSVELRPLIKLRAIASGRYSSWLIASSTRRRVSSATYGWSLSTRETVWIDTPAWDATWRMVAFFPEVIRSHFPLTRVVLNSACEWEVRTNDLWEKGDHPPSCIPSRGVDPDRFAGAQRPPVRRGRDAPASTGGD